MELPEGFIINKSFVVKVVEKDSGCWVQLTSPQMHVETALAFDDLKKNLWGFSPEFQSKTREVSGLCY